MRKPSAELSRNDAAARISAYVYGNLLTLAALVTLTPDRAAEWHGVLLIFATGITTYIAHVFAESLGDRVRSDIRPTLRTAIHEMRNSLPIASSASIPALLLLLSAIGWISGGTALLIAIITVLGRVALLGTVMNHVNREKPSWRSILAGVSLAVVFALIALLKAILTH